jgi:hypothetical protein
VKDHYQGSISSENLQVMVVKARPSRCRSESTFPTVAMASIRKAGRKGALTGSLKPVNAKQVTMMSESKGL